MENIEEKVENRVETIQAEKKAILEQIAGNIAAYNEALLNEDFKKANELDVQLKDLEVKHNDIQARLVFELCLLSETPMVSAFKEYYAYNIVAHKDNKVDGVVTDRMLVQDRERNIDLAKFVKYANDRKVNLPTKWINYVEKFNQYMAMRVATELGFTKAQVNKLATTYYMSEVARKLDLGETPVSNTQLCKLLQTCINEILVISSEDYEQTLKCNNKDVAYILNLYCKKGKSELSVACAKHDFMRRLVCDVVFRLVNDKKYGVEFKALKEKKA